MNGYSIALFVHLLSLVLATAAMAISGYQAWRLRAVDSAAEAADWCAAIGKAVRVFPLATLGLLASGAHMSQSTSTWSASWVIAGIVGLGVIVVLGAGVEGARGRALSRELQSAGLSMRAQLLLRDPLAWGARLTGLMLMLAISSS